MGFVPERVVATVEAMSKLDVAEAVARLIDRSDPERSRYYDALNRQHFGEGASASNFVEFASAEEALASCIVQRGDKGDDREALIESGADPAALLGEGVCRYWRFSAKGRLGVIGVGEVARTALVALVREKPGSSLSLILTGRDVGGLPVAVSRPEVEEAVAIVGIEDGVERLWTLHPGFPAVSGEGAAFEAAGYSDGDVFCLGDLVGEGGGIRRTFDAAGVSYKVPVKVKVPLSVGIV